jgi:RNA-directed DNA polymerase
MATAAMPLIGAPPSLALEWESLDWTALQRQAHRLQVRIAKAVKENRFNRARALQRILTHSFAAKALAVRRVTRNRGKNTPGVDGVLWRSPRQKMLALRSLQRRGYRAQPLRRIYIPKSRGGKRPLGIPTASANCTGLQRTFGIR